MRLDPGGPTVEDVTETFQQMFRRRMAELGRRSVMDMWRALPDQAGRTSYETIRLLVNGQQKTVKEDRVIADLAAMLEVSEAQVRESLQLLPSFGRWDLPPRAQALDPQERDVVISVVDALLRARGQGASDGGITRQKRITGTGGGDAEAEPVPERRGAIRGQLGADEPESEAVVELDPLAAGKRKPDAG